MNGRSSSAHVLFDQINAGGVGFLQGMVNSAPPTFEEEWLDFKGADPMPPDSDIKKLWSKALSGFANTEGGVLIWGIDARKDPTTGVDCASALSLVPDPDALKTRLMELHHQSTDPPVLNVEVESYPDPNGGGAGFVVCLVPESPFKPHRAEHLTNKPYYIRAGDDFVPPSPALLRHLFFPHTYSQLWIEVAVTVNDESALDRKGMQVQNGAVISYEVRIHNSGTATARDVYVVLQTGIRGGRHVGHEWIETANPQGQLAFVGRLPLHPGAVSQLLVLTQRASLPAHPSHGNLLPHLADAPRFVDSTLRFLMYADDREPQVATVTYDDDDVEAQVTKRGVAESGDWHRHIPGDGTTR